MKVGAVAAGKVPEVIRWRLAGRSTTEIAEIMGVSPAAVSTTIHRPDVVRQLEEARRDAYAAIAAEQAALAMEAMRFKAHVMRGMPNEYGVVQFGGTDAATIAVRDRAASDILDRCGVPKGTVVQVNSTQENRFVVELRMLPAESLDAELAALEDALGPGAGRVIDLSTTPEAK